MSIPKISEYFTPTSGLFSKMAFDFEVITKAELDILLYANYGEKNSAPIVTKTLSLPPTDIELTNLAHMIESLYGVKWNKLKDLTKIQYDPIHNYKDTLTEVINDTGVTNATEEASSTNNRTGTTSRDNTRTDNLSNTVQKNSTSTLNSSVNDGVYGFNSETASDTDTSKTLETNTDDIDVTTLNTGTQRNLESVSDSILDSNSGTSTKESNVKNDRTRTSTHSGNIGNLTTQQLMNQEIELWKWNFIQSVLGDLNDFLTIPIYLS